MAIIIRGQLSHDGVVRRAVIAGVVDLTLSIKDMPAAIARFVAHPYLAGNDTNELELVEPSVMDGVGTTMGVSKGQVLPRIGRNPPSGE